MGLTRAQAGQIFRPIGPKPVVLGQTFSGVSTSTLGGSIQLAQFLDLTYPIRGLRFRYQGRLVVGTANFTTTYPESFLNLLSNITIQGTNTRQGGNVVLMNLDLASLYNFTNMFTPRSNYFSINSGSGETMVAVPSTPTPTYQTLNTGTYDFRIVFDLLFHPFGAPAVTVPMWLMRSNEWGSSIQLSVTQGTQAGNATGALGVAAATTTCTYSSYGSASGTPTLDVYSLPVIMGLDLKDQVTPGFLTRVAQPVTSVLQSAGASGTTIVNLQHQAMTRIFAKFGTSTVPNGNPAFATVSDTNVTAMGLKIGGTTIVRNEVDIFAHKQEQLTNYDSVSIIQGYNVLDFIASGDPASAYPGQLVPDGSTLSLTGTIGGVANAYGIIVAEQALYTATGPLYGA